MRAGKKNDQHERTAVNGVLDLGLKRYNCIAYSLLLGGGNLMGRYEVLFTDSKSYCVSGTDLLLSKSALTKDNERDAILVQLKFKSFYQKRIASLYIVITGINLEGRVIEEKPFQYIDVDAGKNEEFGDRTPVYMDDSTVRKFFVHVKKIVFDDGSVETVDSGDCIMIPENTFPLEGDLKEQYVRTVRTAGGSPKAVSTPVKIERFWRCSCGKVNILDDNSCSSCGSSAESVFRNLDENKLSIDLIEFKKREEAEAEEKKKKQASFIKKAAVVCAAIAAVAVLIITYKKVISPALSYSQAEKYYENGDYEKAIAEMSALGEYKDASEQIKKYKYDQAADLYEKGDHNKAKQVFKELGEYSDSKTRYKEIVKEDEYDNAVADMGKGNYEEALSIFEKDLAYRDSAYYAGCINQEEEEYSKAVDQFSKVSDSSEFYKDAVARKEKCESVIQENLNNMHFERGVNFAKKGYLFSAKKEFEDSNGINNAQDYLNVIQEIMDEGWIGVYRSEDSGTLYLGIFCEVDSDLNKTYVVTSQTGNFESVYSGATIQDDGSMRLYDSFNDSVDTDYKSGFVDESEYQIQEDKSVYKKHGGTRGVTGGGSFSGRSYKSFVELSKNDDGDITWHKKTEETKEAREWTNAAGEHKYQPASTETDEDYYNYERIGDE